MSKRCLIIQPKIPHYRYELFSSISKELPGQVDFGYDFKYKKIINKNNFEINSKNFRWKSFGPLIINPDFFRLPFLDYKVYIFNENVRCIFLYPTLFFMKIFSKKRLVLWGHGYGTHYPFFGNILRLILCNCADEYISYSKKGMENILRLCPDMNISVAENTIDLEEFIKFGKQKLKKNLSKTIVLKNKFHFIYISRIEKEKEPFFALEIIYKLLKSGIDVEFSIIGDGSLYKELVERISVLELNERVNLYGAITETSKIIDIAKEADFLLHPGIIGLTTLVGLSMGIPIITLNSERQMPEFQILEDNYNAIFIDLNSIDNTVKKIKQYLEPEKLKEMKNNSISSILNNEELSIDNYKNQFVKVIRKNLS